MVSPISNPGAARIARKPTAWTVENTVPMVTAASRAASTAAPRLPRTRSTMRGKGAATASKPRNGTPAPAEKTRAEATAAASTPLVRGSGLSRAGAETGIGARPF